MTHPESVRQEAIERLTRGESQRGIAKALGISSGTVANWAAQLPAAVIEQIQAPVREQIGRGFMTAAVRAMTVLDKQVQMAAASPEYLRDTAYAFGVMVDRAALVLGWKNEQPAGNTYIDARTQSIALPAGMSIDELRVLARSRASER